VEPSEKQPGVGNNKVTAQAIATATEENLEEGRTKTHIFVKLRDIVTVQNYKYGKGYADICENKGSKLVPHGKIRRLC
jgi:hypothetical protein